MLGNANSSASVDSGTRSNVNKASFSRLLIDKNIDGLYIFWHKLWKAFQLFDSWSRGRLDEVEEARMECKTSESEQQSKRTLRDKAKIDPAVRDIEKSPADDEEEAFDVGGICGGGAGVGSFERHLLRMV